MRGVVTGGWGYVVAAYSVTFTALVSYAATVIARLREEWNKQ